MGGILTTFVIVIAIIVFASIINEKKLHFPQDVSLLLVSFLIGISVWGLHQVGALPFIDVVLDTMKNVKLDSFVLECALGFIMFASASKIHLTKFVKNLLPIRSSFDNNYVCFFDSVWRSVFLGKFSFEIKRRNMDFFYFADQY